MYVTAVKYTETSTENEFRATNILHTVGYAIRREVYD